MSEDVERLRRWRLLLGDAAEESTGGLGSKSDAAMDGALSALYDANPEDTGSRRRGAGLGSSAPKVARWLGDIRTYFPSTVVQVMQKDAVEPDVHLVGTLLSLNRVMPETSKATARMVVDTVVRQIEERIAQKTRTAVTGAINRAARTTNPKLRDVDWNRTIRANLAHYLPEYKTVVPERMIGYGRRLPSVHRDVVLAIDQSGSMASSVVYASVFGAVLASMRALKTSLVVFDTAVVDLTDKLSDPVDVLFGTQLGGGTDINRAIAYSQSLIDRPTESLFVLISDLYEGGIRGEMLRRMSAMKTAGVQVIVLLALSDDGAPSFDHDNAAALSVLGVPAFACTPDKFPELLALALERGDIRRWADSLQTE
ncbi:MULTISPECIES: VWA domain-containing protein [Rhodococcus]|uniref:VWA domain-containing protein n=1 Tax=Rhodococcus oxybenzonivorans TaxID=1990687 RepID=A0AAE5A7G3_9NOCA|nr:MULTISPECIES: VWA domain-containing protein [Rhodococcus]MDV7245106.1 VWA domain-containing protein [Rhodococcus oxybenzonivorans]MDV7266138.1 VWA domain-containing protein [Rhodococcus oxybenzonivorans]MDV7272611.1 VWA domain-containing protein [Rhodococcus oxybenzonivorans]MDV7336131.1 VWA domain-containing protein [Rhodococcus oxybenzonivorans]MDV7342817.1 VWA domain-containing protein [Rhodococcus oxybenzonivorans]